MSITITASVKPNEKYNQKFTNENKYIKVVLVTSSSKMPTSNSQDISLQIFLNNSKQRNKDL